MKKLVFSILIVNLIWPFLICAEEQANERLSLVNYESLESSQQKDNGWKPLSDKEIDKKKKELSLQAVAEAAEYLDSFNLDIISNRMYEILETTSKVDNFQSWLKDKYSVEVEIEFPGEGMLIYRTKF